MSDANEYQKLAARTDLDTPGYMRVRHTIGTSSPQRIRLLHAAIGIATESGELLDAIKRDLFYGAGLDLANVQEEIGDLLWYAAMAATAAHMPLSEIMARNIDKLRKRYPEGFTEAAAVERADKDGDQ